MFPARRCSKRTAAFPPTARQRSDRPVTRSGTWRGRLGGALVLWIAATAAIADDEAPVAAQAAAVATDDATARSRAEALARQFNDPLTIVPQIVLKDVYGPASYGTEAQTNRLIARLLIPRVPRFSFMPDQLIRPTFQLVTVPTGRGTATRTEFGDIQLLDLAVLPWSSPAHGLSVAFPNFKPWE